MFLHHVAHDFDATRSFLWIQLHPGTWFGNIVAGVVVFVVVDLIWQAWLKKRTERWLERRHEKVIAKHHEEVVKPLLEAQHRDLVDQAAHHHEQHMLKLTEALAPRRRAPARKDDDGVVSAGRLSVKQSSAKKAAPAKKVAVKKTGRKS